MSCFRGGLIFKASLLLILLFIGSAYSSSQLPVGDVAKLLPDKFDTYQAVASVRTTSHGIFDYVNPDDVGAVSNGERLYRDADGSTI